MFSVREVAELAGVTPRTVRRHVVSGRIAAVRVGRDYLIPEQVAQAWVASYARYDTLRMPRGAR